MALAFNVLTIATLITLSLIVCTNSLAIDVQPEFVRPSDENVVFTCAGGDDTKKMIKMRLMKLVDTEQWKEIAVLSADGSIDLSDVKSTAVGRLGDVADSYLTVTWPVAPDDINGRYRCDAIVITSTWDIIKEESSDLVVKTPSTDMSPLLERLQKYEKRLVGKINKTMYSALSTSKKDLLSVLDSKVDDLKEYVDKKTAVGISRPEVKVETMLWPAGNFSLLMPSDGCPKQPPAWVTGFEKMKAVPGDKYYPLNIPLHQAIAHKETGFIYRQFCTLPASPGRTEPWPAGSYCLYEMDMFSNKCPTGFTYARTSFVILPDTANLFIFFFPIQIQYSGSFSVIHTEFCCRHDGNATTPIDLPMAHPFYLIRHGGRCQEVRGMDVTQDIFMMETMNNGKNDTWINTNATFRPDVSFNPYKEELCYYSRKTG